MTTTRVQRRRAVAAVGAAVVLATAVAGVVYGATGSSPPPPHRHRALPTTSTTTTIPAPVISLGPDGVVSSAVVAENAKPGTTAWVINDPGPGSIAGFADATYAAVGDQIHLYVSTTASSFRVVAYRMGWYGGTGARQVWASPPVTGVVQPKCPVTPGINMVSCAGWAPSLTVPITADFVPGDYLLKLSGVDGEQSYVLLTVWDPTSTATYLFMARSLTEEGWNTYGGFSFYSGQGGCPKGAPSYPPCNRARVVSFDRPYDSGFGATDFIGGELPLVEFAEQHGLDVTYCTDITVNDHPEIVAAHKALVSLSHDETWTTPERQGAEAALAKGTNVAFMSAAAIVRHARLEGSALGPDRNEVDYRDSAADPLNGKGDPLEVTGNTWSVPPTLWPASNFTGQVYSGYLFPNAPPAAFVVYESGSWIFKGTGLHDGSQIPGVIASDIDHVVPGLPMAGALEVLGHSPVPLADVYTNQGKWGAVTYSDMTYYTDAASKAGVFDSGTVNWINSMTPCPTAPGQCGPYVTSQITGNLLWLFGQGPAGAVAPSVGNLGSVTPPGS